MVLESLFVLALALQVLHLISQDWIDLFPLNDIAQFKRSMSSTSRLLMIVGNSLPAIVALILALIYIGQPKPLGVGLYWVAYFGSVIVLMYTMWYKPYIFGASAEQRQEYAQAYGRTHQIVPPRGDNPRPNSFHVILHMLFLVNTCLALGIGFNLI
jgi:hypothetical protein